MSTYESIIKELEPYNATLVAVSKTKPNQEIQKIYNLGQRDFGENRVQEMIDKHEALPKDIKWHLIGHLQSKKVKNIISFVDYIHSVDSFSLLDEIEKRAQKEERKINILLQIKIAEEDSKYGFDFNELFENLELSKYESLSINGVMGMATFTENIDQVREEFRLLKSYFNLLKEKYFYDKESFTEISMGMSGDYKIALDEGSTMVRIGSLIFGERE